MTKRQMVLLIAILKGLFNIAISNCSGIPNSHIKSIQEKIEELADW